MEYQKAIGLQLLDYRYEGFMAISMRVVLRMRVCTIPNLKQDGIEFVFGNVA